MPVIGGRKLHFLTKEPLLTHHIGIGRDKLFSILDKYGMLIRKRKRRKPITTDSDHPFYKYPNLIKDIEIVRPDQLWVSDITYIATANGFSYLSLITDGYSRKIVGWALWPNLRREGTIEALKMALLSLEGKGKGDLIHHSDRGMQYCSFDYISLLDNRARISMTEKGDPYENALAERINGILKSEFGMGNVFISYDQAEESVRVAINTYNTIRPHSSCNYLTPEQAHQQKGILRKRWKKKIRIESENKKNQTLHPEELS